MISRSEGVESGFYEIVGDDLFMLDFESWFLDYGAKSCVIGREID